VRSLHGVGSGLQLPRYASPAQEHKSVDAAPSPREQCVDSSATRGNASATNLPLTPSSPTNTPGPSLLQNPSCDAAVNLDHMDLLIHVTQDSDVFNLSTSPDSYYPSSVRLGLREANKPPYLLHAISLFNATWTAVDESNCVAALLFSSVLGPHILAETLCRRHPGGLDAFIEHYVQCINMHRGIFVIANSAGPLLMQSELEPLLSMSRAFTSREPVGKECHSLHHLIDRSPDLSEEEKVATRAAIKYLQRGFDARDGEMDSRQSQHQMIYNWAMLVPPKFTALLESKRPEALVVMAYDAVLLHRGKDLWQVGEAGGYIFELIWNYLGPVWE